MTDEQIYLRVEQHLEAVGKWQQETGERLARIETSLGLLCNDVQPLAARVSSLESSRDRLKGFLIGMQVFWAVLTAAAAYLFGGIRHK